MTCEQPDSQSCAAAFERRDGGRHPNPRALVTAAMGISP